MTKLEFRDLRADEIDVRISTFKEGEGMSLLLYKDARCDMNVLDETVGAFNWQRSHSRDNANCTVSIWDEDKKAWISKEDTGTESNTEAEKGLASDSFKRACFNWGIGRELYTAPFIWLKAGLYKGKYDKFIVQDITIKDKKIIGLAIYNKTTKKTVFTFGQTSAKTTEEKVEEKPKPKQEAPKPTAVATSTPKAEEKKEDTPERKEAREKWHLLGDYCEANGLDINRIVKENGLTASSTAHDFDMALVYARSIILTGGGNDHD